MTTLVAGAGAGAGTGAGAATFAVGAGASTGGGLGVGVGGAAIFATVAGVVGVAALAVGALAMRGAESGFVDAGIAILKFKTDWSVAASAVADGPLLAVSAGAEAGLSAPSAAPDAACCAALMVETEGSPLGVTAAEDLSALSPPPPPPPPQPPSKAQAVIKVTKVVRRGCVVGFVVLTGGCWYFMALEISLAVALLGWTATFLVFPLSGGAGKARFAHQGGKVAVAIVGKCRFCFSDKALASPHSIASIGNSRIGCTRGAYGGLLLIIAACLPDTRAAPRPPSQRSFVVLAQKIGKG